MARIAIGGFEHETNTFAPSKATYEDFVRPGAWPGLTRGPALLEAVSGINLPIAGFIDQARQAHHALPHGGGDELAHHDHAEDRQHP